MTPSTRAPLALVFLLPGVCSKMFQLIHAMLETRQKAIGPLHAKGGTVKRSLAPLAALSLFVSSVLAMPRTARAADWPIVTATEEGSKDTPFRFFGFAQVVGEANVLGSRVTGLTAPKLRQYEGQWATFNTLPDSDATWGLSVRRLRPGVRGSVPGTNQKITYIATVELGRAGVTRLTPATPMDVGITFSYIPGARLRIGQFKLPLSDEVVEANPLASEFVNYSNVATQLLLESQVKNGVITSNAYGFRDLGVEAFESFSLGKKLSLAYAFMVSQGRMGAVDDDPEKDVSGRVTTSWVFSGKRSDAHRQELSLYVWGLHGTREYAGARAQRNRSGTGVSLELEPVRLRAEVVSAQGMVAIGGQPPFEGAQVAMAPNGRALGVVAFARVRLGGHVLLKLRYDELHRQTESAPDTRIFRTLTPALEVQVTPKMRLMLDYERRWILAPDATADAKRIVDTAGDRVMLQASVFLP